MNNIWHIFPNKDKYNLLASQSQLKTNCDSKLSHRRVTVGINTNVNAILTVIRKSNCHTNVQIHKQTKNNGIKWHRTHKRQNWGLTCETLGWPDTRTKDRMTNTERRQRRATQTQKSRWRNQWRVSWQLNPHWAGGRGGCRGYNTLLHSGILQNFDPISISHPRYQDMSC